MQARTLADGILWLGAVDWDRRLFDAVIPTPEGTSYNAYLVRGAEKVALLDSADPAFRAQFLRQLEGVPRVDYVIAHHAEQDHSGCLPDVLARYPQAELLCTTKARQMLCDLLPDLPAERIRTVEDGERLELGGRTLRFLYLPWVHWPETMASYLEEDKILFSCDFFGSHLATSSLWASGDDRTLAAAKLYYAQIMMPYAPVVRKDLEKVKALDLKWIAPSHGPVYDKPEMIIQAHDQWLNALPRNKVVIAHVSTHGSTAESVDKLSELLVAQGIEIEPFELTRLQLDRLAASLVDAGTVVFAAPAIWNAPHPLAVMAMYVTAGLKPKAGYVGTMGSFGWSQKAIENVSAFLPGWKAEVLKPVNWRGAPRKEAFAEIEVLAKTIAEKHAAAGYK